MVRDCSGEDHRGYGESGDAQCRAQRHAPVRSDQGFRQARGRAGGDAQPGEPRRADRRTHPARTDPRSPRSPPGRGAVDRTRPRQPRCTNAVAGRIVPGARMSAQTAQSQASGSRQRTRSCATGLTCHRCDNHYPLESTVFACPDCGKGLDIVYDYDRAASHFRDVPAGERPQNIWHFEELLPIVDASAQARVGCYTGYTPLIRADRLGAELGLSNLYLKDDSTSRPSLSYKDRVVSMSVARLLELDKQEIGCVSTDRKSV